MDHNNSTSHFSASSKAPHRPNLWVELSAFERFFVETIAISTDANSLDSLRVPCLNSRLAFEELAHELKLRLVGASELSPILDETIKIADAEKSGMGVPPISPAPPSPQALSPSRP